MLMPLFCGQEQSPQRQLVDVAGAFQVEAHAAYVAHRDRRLESDFPFIGGIPHIGRRDLEGRIGGGEKQREGR